MYQLYAAPTSGVRRRYIWVFQNYESLVLLTPNNAGVCTAIEPEHNNLEHTYKPYPPPRLAYLATNVLRRYVSPCELEPLCRTDSKLISSMRNLSKSPNTFMHPCSMYFPVIASAHLNFLVSFYDDVQCPNQFHRKCF